jgi:aquaporin related protein
MPHLPVHRDSKHPQDGHANGHRSERSPARLSTFQAHLVAASGEFVGTFMFLYFSFACQTMLTTQASEKSLLNGGTSSQQNIFTALVYGFSLLVNVWAFYRISGGLFNPAVCTLEFVQFQFRPDFPMGN